MNDFEKVEKLKEHANVTYEEAREALRHANGDLLDAMVYLEQQGKATKPEVSSYTTRYEEQRGYEKVEQETSADPDKEAAKRFGSSLRRFIKTIWRKLTDNALRMINREGEEVFRIPLWILALVVLFFWHGLVVVLVILLFFGNRYEIVGKDDMTDANEFLNRAGNMANGVKEEFRKSRENEG